MSKQSYDEQKARVKQNQENRTYDQIRGYMQRNSEFSLELDKLEPQKHIWIDRGLKLTCETAGHNYHEAWKRRPAKV